MEIDRNLAHEDLATGLQAIEKLAVAAVQFIECPCRYAHPIAQCEIDLVQGNLRLGTKLDFVGYVVFFRRAGSLAQSSGRYTVLSSRT